MVGVVPLETALQTAAEAGLDLVEISPKASPPVCKIIDFGKYKYEIKRNLQKAKKKQKVIELKEVRLRPSIGAHDLDIKINQIRGFITKGKKVKVSMRFRGREITYFALGKEVFEKLVAKVSDIAEPESTIKSEKAYITAVLVEKTKEV
jgi:translation initiation factor IF-3